MGSEYLWKPVRTLRQACRGSLAHPGTPVRNCLLCELADRCLLDGQDGAHTAAELLAEDLVQDLAPDVRARGRIGALPSPKRELSS